jgi:hypothetical protein
VAGRERTERVSSAELAKRRAAERLKPKVAQRPADEGNKRTAERETAMKELAAQIGKAVGSAFEGDALAYLMSIYKDPSKPENLRIDAAKAAIRYERPALAPVEHATDSDFVPLTERLKAYEREDEITASASKVVELKKPGQR